MNGFEIDDEPLDGFYPICAACGEPIYGDGYKIGDDYYCEDCVKPISGTDEAINAREARYEAAAETMFEASRDECCG